METFAKIEMNDTLEKQLPIALIKLTQAKVIRWKILNRGQINLTLFDGGFLDGYVYETEVNNKTVLLFRFTYDYTDEHDIVRHDFSYRLVISDSSGIPETEMDGKYKYCLDILYDIVRESCHDVSNWAKEVVELAK
ncbi:MAG: hypothetical protein LBP87_02040 [Planctomycetaceae bacterium]|nr:hypothetical protein [Planctomycetaceae bacterium]